ncbi:type I secretion system permease/ATPase [Octadecabacter sp. G9-8]|uniref:Type I secretion system permease/ATPase n=1 Tax=Octadecabacter dasysiphoniae TaxID=2909341 RepID=A0ABS9CYH2_9RHOB|nr:type I secretion system permease/ATPase [Octadecabacter dasysiphoniae]MCF2872307.1 type I secretion system permease/ATPase [Octadecabacter dasysiphoniae]
MTKAQVIQLDQGRTDPPKETGATSLEACVMYVAAMLDRPVTLTALQEMQDDVSGVAKQDSTSPEQGVRAAIAAAERAGMQAAFGRREAANLNAMALPAILTLREGGALVVLAKLKSGMLSVYDPERGDGTGQITLDAVTDHHTGHVLLLRAIPREDMATGDGARGHWFWSALAANRWAYAQVVLAAALANVLGLVTSLFTMVVYDRILPNEATESLIALTIGVGIALIFDFVIKLLRAGFIDRAGRRADMTMGRRIFDHLLDVQISAHRGSTGATAATLREFESIRDFFTSATLVAVIDLPFVILFVFVVWLIGGPLALIPAVAIPLVLVIGIVVQPILGRLAERSFTQGQSKQSVLVETLSGLEAIKAAGAARRMRTRWEEAVDQQSSYTTKSRSVTQFVINATGFIQQTSQILIVFYGVFLISAGTLSMGALIASVILTGRALAPLAQLAQTLTRLNQARSSYRSLNTLMRFESERPQGRSWLSRPRLDGAIRFDKVHFTYPDAQTDALSGVSFSIEPGEKVAIIGRIGSGKSTIARLLLGLYQPREGAVMIDGTDIRQIDPGDLRRNVGAVLQDVWLFSGTIRDNIAVGAPRPRDEDVLEAARIAGVDEFVARHPMGFDQILEERGAGLSGGQKQAITLARALLGQPSVLLLDEPTSAMDVQSEAAVIARLRDAAADRTMVIVTHRTSLLSLVDRVIVLENGQVVADGPKGQILRSSDGGS